MEGGKGEGGRKGREGRKGWVGGMKGGQREEREERVWREGESRRGWRGEGRNVEVREKWRGMGRWDKKRGREGKVNCDSLKGSSFNHASFSISHQ